MANETRTDDTRPQGIYFCSGYTAPRGLSEDTALAFEAGLW